MKNKYISQAGFSFGNFLLEFIQSIVLALSVFVVMYLFVAQPNEVKGSSMFPNFKDQEYLLTEKLSYQFGTPKRGDVVIFKAPSSEPCSADECEYIKRVIGLPGDTVMVKDSKVYLNGELLDESAYLASDVVTEEEDFMQEGVAITVPEGKYLCFGDNRPNSRDGRAFGPIEKSLIIGKAFFVYWPLQEVSLVPKVKF